MFGCSAVCTIHSAETLLVMCTLVASAKGTHVTPIQHMFLGELNVNGLGVTSEIGAVRQ